MQPTAPLPLWALLFLTIGCPSSAGRESSSAGRESINLIDAQHWSILERDDDPFPAHRADAKRLCNQGGFGEDLGVLDIDTQVCSYVSAAQKTLADALPGDQLNLLAWHQALASTDVGAQGHMALLLDGEPLWDLVVDIPASPEVYDVFFPVDEPIPAGTEVVVHVHNHGGNTWRLAHLEAVPPDAP